MDLFSKPACLFPYLYYPRVGREIGIPSDRGNPNLLMLIVVAWEAGDMRNEADSYTIDFGNRKAKLPVADR